MRKGKGRSSVTLAQEERQESGDGVGDLVANPTAAAAGGGVGGMRVFGCYLLVSLSPRHKGHTYIGFTVNPKRRIRQHNGEIRSGAWRTKTKRPWEMALFISGFPTQVAALQFEWAWQHPLESLAVREAAASFKSLCGLSNKIKLAYTMLSLCNWKSMDLTLNFFSTKYMAYAAGCPSLPKKMEVQICSMDELPCYSKMDQTAAYRCENDCNCSKEHVDAGSIIQSIREEPMVPLLPDFMHVADDGVRQASGQFPMQEYLMHQIEYGFSSPRADQALPFQVDFVDTSIRSVGRDSSRTRISVPGNSNCNDENHCTLVGESLHPCARPSKEQSPSVGLANILQPCSGREVEVIDLFTPSPACSSKPCGKRTRVSMSCADIIDLTRSPLFIQL